MAVDMFIKLAGIRGESRDARHRDEIQVDSFAWGLSNTGSALFGGGGGGGGGAGKVSFQDFSFAKSFEKSSPSLMLHCATGQHIKDAVFTCRRAAVEQEPFEFLKITFEDILVSSINTGANTIGGGEAPDRLTENVTLNFAKVMVEYTEQTEEGKPGEKPTFNWDLAKNAKF